VSDLLKSLAPLLEHAIGGPVAQTELVAIVKQNIYGDRLTERIVRSLIATAPFRDPASVGAVLDEAKTIGKEGWLLSVDDDLDDSEGAAESHDRLGLAISGMDGDPYVSSRPYPKPPAVIDEAPEEVIEQIKELIEESPGTLMAQAELVVDPIANLLGLNATPEETPVPEEEEEFSSKGIAVWETTDNSDGSRHVHIPGVRSCLIHGQQCDFAKNILMQQEEN